LKLSGTGAGRMHFYESVRTDYFDQLTGEVKAPSRTQRGKMVWQQKSGTAIEAWDCECYLIHCAMVEKLHLKKKSWWEAKRAALIQVDMLGDQSPDDLITNIDHRPNIDIDAVYESGADLLPESKPQAQKSPKPTPKKQGLSLKELGRIMNG
jgi:phage terminase large subunit GpA-like protein